MFFFFPHYAPLSDDELGRANSTAESSELFVDFVTVLQSLVTPKGSRTYSASVFPAEQAESVLNEIIDQFRAFDINISSKMQTNHDNAKLIASSPVPHSPSDAGAAAACADSFIDQLLTDYDEFREKTSAA